jgi:hypothetical protein
MRETLSTITTEDEKFWQIVGDLELPFEPDEDLTTGQEKLPIETPSQEDK